MEKILVYVDTNDPNRVTVKPTSHQTFEDFFLIVIRCRYHISSRFICQTPTPFSTAKLCYMAYRMAAWLWGDPSSQQNINYLAALHSYQDPKLSALAIYTYSFFTTDQRSTKRSEAYMTFIKVPKFKIILL
ncbi:hypothetical protein AB4K20DRAFT_1948335 [Rhizopus microsporus]